MKKLLSVGLGVLGVLIACALVMNVLAPSPVLAAKQHCIEQGWSEAMLSLKEYESSAGIHGSSATVHIIARKGNDERTLRVDLHKGLFSTSWEVIAFDGPPEQEKPSGD